MNKLLLELRIITMKPIKLFFAIVVTLLPFACGVKHEPKEYLRKALGNVERIKVAGYELEEKVKAPYEKNWNSVRRNKYIEQDNPQDTTIGASALHYDGDGHILSVYDGTNYAYFHHY